MRSAPTTRSSPAMSSAALVAWAAAPRMCFTWWASASGCKYAADAAHIAARAASPAAAVSASRAALSDGPCGVDRFARAGVGRVCSLEDLQDSLRALSGVTGDLTKVLYAQND